MPVITDPAEHLVHILGGLYILPVREQAVNISWPSSIDNILVSILLQTLNP